MDGARDIDAYFDTEPPAASHDRDFALASGFSRIDDDQRSVTEIPDTDLLLNFGD